MAEIIANTGYNDKIYKKNSGKTLSKGEIKHIIEKLHKKLNLPDDLKNDIFVRTINIAKIINNKSNFSKPKNLVAIVTFVRMRQRGININEKDIAHAAGINSRIIDSFMLQMKRYIKFK